ASAAASAAAAKSSSPARKAAAAAPAPAPAASTKGGKAAAAAAGAGAGGPAMPTANGAGRQESGGRPAVAMQAFDGEEPTDLPFAAGARIRVLRAVDDAWSEG